MNARIEKKLSKHLVELLPKVYKYAWKEYGVNEQAYSEGNRVKNCFCVGGGVDYWGEGEDAYTVWDDFKSNYMFIGNFPVRDINGFEFEWPDTSGFKETTPNLIKLAREINKGE